MSTIVSGWLSPIAAVPLGIGILLILSISIGRRRQLDLVTEGSPFPTRYLGLAIVAGIAVAFVATLYGVGSANIFFIPMAKKIKRKAILEGHARTMVAIGVEGILSGLNPKVIEEKLAIFAHGHKTE